MEPTMNHFDQEGNAIMVDVGGKEPTVRTATAEGLIRVSRPVLEAITGRTAAKGDVLCWAWPGWRALWPSSGPGS